MPKKKTESLLAKVKSLEPVPYKKKKDWSDRLRESSPEDYADVMSVVDDYCTGGASFHVFTNVRCLHAWLTGNDPDRPLRQMITVSESQFRNFINARQKDLNGQASKRRRKDG